MGTEIVTVVDTMDREVGTAARAEMRRRGLIYRATYLLVFNGAGELLVQRRTVIKDQYPGLLDFAAGGVVCGGEGYAESAARELAEELGITAPLTPHFDIWFEDAAGAPPKRNCGRVFSCRADGPFSLQASEVAAVEFMAVDTALALPRPEVTPDSRHVLLAYAMEN